MDTNTPLVLEEKIAVVFFILVAIVGGIFLWGAIPLIMLIYFNAKRKSSKSFEPLNLFKILLESYLLFILVFLGLLLLGLPTGSKDIPFVYLGLFAGLIYYLLFRYCYYNILLKHKEWVSHKANFFSGRNQTKSNKTSDTKPSDEISRLYDMKDKGIIDDEEFKKLKSKIISQ